VIDATAAFPDKQKNFDCAKKSKTRNISEPGAERIPQASTEFSLANKH